MITADDIAGCLARTTFKDSLCVVDRCYHVGEEADLLVLTPSLHYVDVEIKVSRADLKADRTKDKWRQSYASVRVGPRRPDVERDWPRSVWKHYYALPAAIWKPELLEFCGRKSGVLLIHPREGKAPRWWRVECVRRSKPDPAAPKASAERVLKLARLASLRMWDAYAGTRT